MWKNVFIIGPGHGDTGVQAFSGVLQMIQEFCGVASNACKIIGDGERNLSIETELPILNGSIDHTTRIAIIAHGYVCKNHVNCPKPIHALKHAAYPSPTTPTSNVLSYLAEAAPKSPLQVHLFSCYAGFASRDATTLHEGSVLITYGRDDQTTVEHVNNEILRHYLQSPTSSPMQYFMSTIAYQAILQSSLHLVQDEVYHFSAAPSNIFVNPKESLIKLSKKFQEFYQEYSDDSLFLEERQLTLPQISEKMILDHFQMAAHKAIHIQDNAFLDQFAAQQPALLRQAVTRSPSNYNNITLFFDAVKNNQHAANIFYKHGADVNEVSSHTNATPIFSAIIQHDSKMVDFLVKRGANLTVTSSASGTTYMPYTLAEKRYSISLEPIANMLTPHQEAIAKIWNIIHIAEEMRQQLEGHFKDIPATTQFLALSYLKAHQNSYSGKACNAGDTSLYSYVDWKGGTNADMKLVCEMSHSPLSSEHDTE